MNITDIRWFAIKDWRTFLFVLVETDAGHTGLGESGLSGQEHAVAGMLEHLKPRLIGADPFRTEHLWQTMWRGGFFPAGEVLSSAIAALDVALWDIKAQALGVPLYEILGGRVRDRVATYTHLRGTTPDDIVRVAEAAVAEGWLNLRWEPFADDDGLFDERRAVDRAIAEAERLRASVGQDIGLCFDAHTKLSPAEAVRLCRALEPMHPLFVEDPLRSENPASYRRLRAQTAVPIAAGEQYGTKWRFRELVEDELIDYARVDICIAGGFTEALKIAAMCETHHIDIAVHNPLGPVSTAACLHFNLACSNMLVQELPKLPGAVLPDLITGQPDWKDGYLLPPEAPGLGLTLKTDRIADHASASTPLPIVHRADGSLTNW